MIKNEKEKKHFTLTLDGQNDEKCKNCIFWKSENGFKIMGSCELDDFSEKYYRNHFCDFFEWK